MYTSIVDISDQNQENSDLETVLQDVIMLNDIQSDINELILEQGEKINIIDNNLKSTETTLERSNATLDETTIRSWYQNKLSSKLMITDVAGNTAEDEKTIEERVKETLDNDLEASIYLAQNKASEDIPVNGLPY